jgi:cytochrome c553
MRVRWPIFQEGWQHLRAVPLFGEADDNSKRGKRLQLSSLIGVVQMERAMVWSIAFMAALLATSQLQAQQTSEAKRGLSVAKMFCAHCHSIGKRSRRSPDPAAPRFEDIANSPGMTATTISVALQTTPHRTMPTFKPNREALSDLSTYILSLKRAKR